jgi:A/G-specific adenine glycosylase
MSTPQKYFTQQLTEWHSNVNERALPWKEEKDPYKIWLSEIILQQTRAEQGLKYYLAFTENYPALCDLANARDEEVFRLWQGLGYYNRCKNMLATARFICSELAGKFPDNYQDILALKGVGAYTAAAIASFAFSLPYAVVDGNVYRVLSRYFGMEEAIDSTEGKRKFAALAQVLLDTTQSAQYNQAIMDLGATICTPKQTKCDECPLCKKCIAFKQNLISLLPIKEKKLKVQNRYFDFLVLQYESEIWIERRSEKGIWQNLHQFYLIEQTESIDNNKLSQLPVFKEWEGKFVSVDFCKSYKQRLTHQLIEIRFYLVRLKNKSLRLSQGGFWVKREQLNHYAFPKTLVDFIEEFITT